MSSHRSWSLTTILALPVAASAGTYLVPTVIDSSPSTPHGIALLDMDGDGDLDLVHSSLSTNATQWADNQGGGVFGPPTDLSTSMAASTVRQADLDGDGDLDIVAVALYTDQLVWFDNVGGGAYTETVLEVGTAAKGVAVDDLDGDGDLDIVRGGMLGGSLAWLENLGGGVFGAATTVDPGRVDAAVVHTADLDGDGDADLVASYPSIGELVWYPNLGGGSFGSAELVAATTQGDQFVVGDVDGDLRPDVLYTDYQAEEVVAVHNDPGGFAAVVLATGLVTPMPVVVVDLDLDGDLDVAAATPSAGTTWLFENLGGGVFSPVHVVESDIGGTVALATGDVNDDGLPDLAGAGDQLVAYLNVQNTTWTGGDYGGTDLVVGPYDVLEGHFTNVGLFAVPDGITALVAPTVPFEMHADNIVIEGMLTADAAGEPRSDGDGDIPDGTGLGGGEAGDTQGAGGGSMGGKGGKGGNSSCLVGPTQIGGSAGERYGVPWDTQALLGSSGGAGGNGSWETVPGGAGGGAVALFADTLLVAAHGSVTARGEDAREALGADTSGGGGGSGGTLVLSGQSSVVVDGELQATGGDGGKAVGGFCSDTGGGGGGGGGIIKVFGPYSGAVYPSSVGGGKGGAGADKNGGTKGQVGILYIDELLAGPPTLTITGGATTDLTVTGATPFATLAVMTGSGAGAEPIPNGLCEGDPTGLAGVEVMKRFHADELGSLSRSSASPAIPSGTPVQVVDELSCTVSSVVPMP